MANLVAAIAPIQRRWRTLYLGGPPAARSYQSLIGKLANVGIDVEERKENVSLADTWPAWPELVLLNASFASHGMQEIASRMTKRERIQLVRISMDWSRTLRTLCDVGVLARPHLDVMSANASAELEAVTTPSLRAKARWTGRDRLARGLEGASEPLVGAIDGVDAVDDRSIEDIPTDVLDALTAPEPKEYQMSSLNNPPKLAARPPSTLQDLVTRAHLAQPVKVAIQLKRRTYEELAELAAKSNADSVEILLEGIIERLVEDAA